MAALVFLRIISMIFLVITLVWGARMYLKHKDLFAEDAQVHAETSGQRLYNKTQIISVWLFCVLLFGLMTVIL